MLRNGGCLCNGALRPPIADLHPGLFFLLMKSADRSQETVPLPAQHLLYKGVGRLSSFPYRGVRPPVAREQGSATDGRWISEERLLF